MSFSFLFILMLLGNGPIVSDIWNHPPEDLASLVAPEMVLKQLQVETDETALIALLTPKGVVKIPPEKLARAVSDLADGDFKDRKRARNFLRAAGEDALPHLQKAVDSEDPEVRVTAGNVIKEIREERQLARRQDSDYVKRLMAICALSELQSKAALPALNRIAASGNPTLAKAAEDAVQTINGKTPTRPEGVGGLKTTMQKLPKNAAFAIALDMERGSKKRRLANYLDEVRKEAAKKPELQAMTAQLSQIEAQLVPGLIELLAKIGNIRIDSITMLVSDDIGAAPQSGYAAFIFTGLHDPDMLTAAIKQEDANLLKREEGGLTVHYSNDVAFCSPDKNTFILAFSEANDGRHIAPITKAWQSRRTEKVAAHLKPAFTPVLNKSSRIAAAGRLSEPQKNIARGELTRELDRMRNRGNAAGPQVAFGIGFLELTLELINAKQYAAVLTKDSELQADAEYDDPRAAAKLGETLKKFDVLLRDTLRLAFEQKPNRGRQNPMAAMLADIDFSKPWFDVNTDDNRTEATLNAPGNTIGVLPMLFFMGAAF